MNIRIIFPYLFCIFIFSCGFLRAKSDNKMTGYAEITKWRNNKKTAVSITYDGGTINQFKFAVPIMDELKIPASFFVVTGDIKGSKYEGKFIGRPLNEIFEESKRISLNKDNFLERATALRFLGYENAREHHTKAGDFFELGKTEEAYKTIDEAYQKIYSGEYKPINMKEAYKNNTVDTSWDEIRNIASRGYEFASHSITHPQFGITDDANMLYELEMSRKEILEQLGEKHTFSHECPHGVENKRTIDFALKVYPALRNRMPEPFLEELNRWNKKDPTTSTKEYVQWQRGPKTDTKMEQMKSWIDTCLTANNIWLVLVFHGIDGIGYQPKTSREIKEYFNYIKQKEKDTWIAAFQDVTKYIRERMNSKISSKRQGEKIIIELTHSIDKNLYNYPLTLKTYIPENWKTAHVKQGEIIQVKEILKDRKGKYIIYDAIPNTDHICIY